jgi:multidrug transporter EmrE-like cation transporter
MSYGLATKISSAQESTIYDVFHVSATAIGTIVSSVAFQPFPLSKMIRLTFIVGGGKATRANYDDGALAACVSPFLKP